MSIKSQHVNSFGGLTAGYAVLIYAIDARGKGGRIPVEPNYAPGYRNDDPEKLLWKDLPVP